MAMERVFAEMTGNYSMKKSCTKQKDDQNIIKDLFGPLQSRGLDETLEREEQRRKQTLHIYICIVILVYYIL